MVYAQRGGLGNFIHQTPAYRRLAEKTRKKVKINFEREYVRQCFLDCPFIEHTLEKGKYIPDYDGNYQLLDYEFNFQAIANEDYNPSYNTYVDIPSNGTQIQGDYIVFMNGAGGDDVEYQNNKRMTIEMLGSILDLAALTKHKVVFVGSESDWAVTLEGATALEDCTTPIIGDIRDCLYVMSNAKMIVANDTGLYHAATTMKVPIMVSDRVPNRPNGLPSVGIKSANKSIEYVSESEWKGVLLSHTQKLAINSYI